MKTLMKNFYQLCKPYWLRRNNGVAWLLAGLVIGIGSVITYLNVRIADWSKGFYDALANLEIDKSYSLLTEYFIYIAIFIVINVYRTWLRKLLTIRWRTFMTEQFLNQWFSNRIYYRLAQRQKMDNPDQRIAEDINLFISYTIELIISFVFNVIQLWAFFMVLWNLAKSPEFNLFGTTWVIDGYLVWVALIYAAVGTLLTHLIGHKLHNLNYHQQAFEADFRSSLVRKQANAEQIALYQGEAVEQASLANEFKAIVQNWRKLMDKEKHLGFFTVGYDRFSLLLPVLFSIPLLAAKVITFGGIMQIRTAFSVVISAFSWFIFAYSTLPKWSATISRLSQLKQEMDALAAQIRPEAAKSDAALDTQGLSLFTPENHRLLSNLTLQISGEKWVRLKGRSGLGKSTLLRVLSGIWDHYSGEYCAPARTRLLVPQRSYLNDGTLSELLSYPTANRYSEAELNAVLAKVGLAQWQHRLNEIHPWAHIFSGGEQQRIAFARVLLNQPAVIYFDEATSNLDPTAAAEMFSLIKQQLPTVSVIFITHQLELDHFADEVVDLDSLSA